MIKELLPLGVTLFVILFITLIIPKQEDVVISEYPKLNVGDGGYDTFKSSIIPIEYEYDRSE